MMERSPSSSMVISEGTSTAPWRGQRKAPDVCLRSTARPVAAMDQSYVSPPLARVRVRFSLRAAWTGGLDRPSVLDWRA